MRSLLIFILMAISLPSPAGAAPGCQDLAWRSTNPAAQNPLARKFISALTEQKDVILALYPELGRHQYDELAQLAIAIMGAESTYYRGGWYIVKDWTPAPLLQLAKCVRRLKCQMDFGLSLGPTQMKKKSIPARVQFEYNITPSSLASNPEHAAVATVAFLIELRDYIQDLQATRYKRQMPYLNDDSMGDHLIYFYQGKGSRILKGEQPIARNNGHLAAVHEHLIQIEATLANPAACTVAPQVASDSKGAVVGAMD